MTLNHVKLGHAVTFVKCVASVAALVFLALSLIWNNITFWHKIAESCTAGAKWAHEQYLQKKLSIFLFLFDLSLLNVKISRAYN